MMMITRTARNALAPRSRTKAARGRRAVLHTDEDEEKRN
jgi:hypothetical protein